jgi:thiol-disulfide isomerase/thioredoxin
MARGLDMAKKVAREDRAARQRELQRVSDSRKQHQQRESMMIRAGGAIALGLVIVVAGIFFFAHGATSNNTAIAASASLGGLSTSRPSGSTGNFHHVSAPFRQGRKPVFLFVGAQYCPYCAAERWGIVKALSRFGTWSNLRVGHSSDGSLGDNLGSIPTFELFGAQYRSRYLAFQSRDVEDNAGNTLQSLSTLQQTLFNRYDSTGSIPFVYVDGYAMSGSGYSPTELQGHSFAEITRQLQANGHAVYANDINGEANLLTALVCKADGNQPGSVCNQAVIRGIARSIT